MKKYDIIIIGGGFAGLTLTYHLPKKYKILILEKKKALNVAYESTGLMTLKTKELLESFVPDLGKYLTNDIDTIGVVGTDFKRHFFSSTKKPWVFSTDTPEMIAHMGRMQGDNVEIKTGVEFQNLKNVQDEVEVTVKENEKNNEYKKEPNLEAFANPRCAAFASSRYDDSASQWKFIAKFVVGADGRSSKVAKSANLSLNTKFLVGAEKLFYGDILLGENPNSTVYHYWFGEFSLGYGGWLSPTTHKGKKAFRIGLAKLENDVKGLKKLNDFISRLKKEKHINPEGEFVYSYGGFIPINGPLRNYYKNRVLLLGDACGLCGAFAADGIKGALASGIVGAELIDQYFEKKDELVFKKYYEKINKYENLIKYFKKQKLYRFIWDKMKKNKTFDAMFDVIAAEKDLFLNKFSEAKNKGGGLVGILLKWGVVGRVIKYGVLWVRDFVFYRTHHR